MGPQGIRRALLAAALFLYKAPPTQAYQCVFYLKRSPPFYEGRVYNPATEKDEKAGPAKMNEPDVLWDGRYHRVYWLAEGELRRAWWKESGKPEKPIPLPEEFKNRAAWMVQHGRPQVIIFANAGKALERWEYHAPEKLWRVIERERFTEAGVPLAEQGRKKLFQWTERRPDWPLQMLVKKQAGNAHIGPHILWEGQRESRQGFWRYFGQDDCGLKIQVQRDEAGAHIVAPLIHWCKRAEPKKKRKPGYPEQERRPIQGKLLYDAAEGAEFAPLGFGQSGNWLLVGREEDMSSARLFRTKDGSLKKAFPPNASHAVWVPCPRGK